MGTSLDGEALRLLLELVDADKAVNRASSSPACRASIVDECIRERSSLARQAKDHCEHAGIDWHAFEAEWKKRV